jgi:hypothetical protein
VSIRYVELKSYKTSTALGNDAVKRLINYLANIEKLSELRYVFNAKNSLIQKPKKKCRRCFKEAGKWDDIFDVLFISFLAKK